MRMTFFPKQPVSKHARRFMRSVALVAIAKHHAACAYFASQTTLHPTIDTIHSVMTWIP